MVTGGLTHADLCTFSELFRLAGIRSCELGSRALSTGELAAGGLQWSETERV